MCYKFNKIKETVPNLALFVVIRNFDIYIGMEEFVPVHSGHCRSDEPTPYPSNRNFSMKLV